MNKKDYILLLLCMMPIIVFAQKKSSIKPTNYRVEKLIPGTDTYVTEYMRSVEDAGIMNLQESVTFIDANDKKRTFTPDSMITFYIKKEAYTAFTFESSCFNIVWTGCSMISLSATLFARPSPHRWIIVMKNLVVDLLFLMG